MIKHLLSALVLSFAVTLQVFAQNGISGKVVDEEANPLEAVTVMVKGTKTFAITVSDGSYFIPAKKGDILEFSLLGMKTKTVTVSGNGPVNVTLETDRTMLEDVVVVGYGTQKRQSITGAISKVNGEALAKAPAQNLTNMMGGVVPGVVSYQASGVPGGDASSLLVRGSGAKVIVDGVNRSMEDIDPNEIESISVLKDASAAAVYGMNAEAVIIITTKRGDNRPARISYHGSYTLSTNAVNLELLDGPSYAYYYNLARVMDGGEPLFTQEQVDAMLNGDDSDGWGNTNWYKEVFGTGHTQNHTVSATGGNDKSNWFATIGYYGQEGNVKNYTHDRVNMRVNFESKVSKDLTLNVGMVGRFTETDRPGISADPDAWNNIGLNLMRIHPYLPKTFQGYYTASKPNVNTASINGYLEDSGYGRSKSDVFQGTGTLRYDAPFLKGLSAKVMVAYDITNSSYKNKATPFNVMVATLPTSTSYDPDDPLLGMTYNLANGFAGITEMSVTQGAGRTSTLTSNVSVEYNNTFGKHEIGALLLMEAVKSDYAGVGGTGYGFDIAELDDLNRLTDKEKSYPFGSSSHTRTLGYVGRINYSYDSKYLAELSFRYDGSWYFYGSDGVWGKFPALSLGWRIDREDWFKNLVGSDMVNILKLRAGSGLTGSVGGVGAYSYLNTMSIYSNTAVIGGSPVSSIYTSALANTELTWQKTWQNNIGLDLTMWDGKFRFEGDVFYKYLYDIVTSASGEVPASWGGYYKAYENRNKQEHHGFEVLLEHRNKVGDFSYGINLVGSYTFRRWLSYPDAENWPDYWKVTGSEVGSIIGFKALGLFKDQEDIDNSALVPGSAVRPGDIKYEDRNGDGKITYDQDMGYVGGSVYPRFQGGINLDAAWKGFDISMKWTYALGRTVALTGVYTMEGSAGYQDNTSYTKPFYSGGNSPRYLIEDSWREDNTDARFPRLCVDQTSNNNSYSSTWWYEDGSYLRLKQLQLGYTIPKSITGKIGLGNCRIFLEGTNLLTFSKVMKYNIDPEMPSVNNGYYPQQKLYGFGIDVQF